MNNFSNLDDLSLVSNVQKEIDVEACLSELINRHSGIFYKASSNYLAAGQLRNDFFNDKEYFFYTVASKFDKTRGCTINQSHQKREGGSLRSDGSGFGNDEPRDR